ncbi:hypothetical protein Hanom_Chr04g00304821 [Helianthus anomalus]
MLKIFWFGKFSPATRYHLLISDHGYRTNNGIVQLFLLIFLQLLFFFFFSFNGRDELDTNQYRIDTDIENIGYGIHKQRGS